MSHPQRHPRAIELLADAALSGLGDDERQELYALDAGDDISFDLAAAAIDLATLPLEPMPSGLEARITAAIDSERTPTLRLGRPPSAPVSMMRVKRGALPWLAAAACALVAVGALAFAASRSPSTRIVELEVPVAVPAPPAPPPSLAAQREALIARAPDATTAAWTRTKDPAAGDVSGDIVWSEAEQRGFMRFRGLPANDPSRFEYQLWVFDGAQAHPIDGGVFDIGAEASKDGDYVIVPIVAKLRVLQPTLFAVTVEKPGGVVVSKKEHIVITAAVKG